MKEEKEMISKVNGDSEDNSSEINKGRKDDCQLVVQEQNESEPSSGNDLAAITKQETVSIKSNNTTDPSKLETNTDHSSPSRLKSEQEGDELKLANYKAKMGEVREENEKLKVLLARIMTDYQSLQSQFLDILRQQEAKISKPGGCKSLDGHHQSACRDDDQLVSLSLGRSSRPADDETRKNEMTIKQTRSGSNSKDRDHEEGVNAGDQLALVLGSLLSETTKNYSKFDNTFDDKDRKELDDQDVEPTDIWPPSKVLKMARSSGIEDLTSQDDGVSQTSPLKKVRVSIRARCNAPTMNDGCHWRKYGQKIAKGNPCPRAYYRCTVSPSCPVRKQVQRCAEDMSILITTYEGTHNHPLPISATPMASTTSAAASMLQSRSTASSSQPVALLLPSAISSPISAATSSNPTHPLGLNFSTTPTTTSTTLFQNSLIKPSPQQQQFYFPNASISTSNNSHPTVTLDLTLPHPPYSSHILGGGSLSSNTSSAPKSYPSTCLSFSSSSSSSSSFLEPIINNHYNNYFNFRNNPLGSNGINYNKQPLIQDSTFYQPYLNSINNNNNQTSTALTNQQSVTETIAAATKAITSNPNFKSALAAALTSIVGNSGPQEL